MLYVLIPLLPFLAFVVLGLGGHWLRERSHLVAVPAVIGSFLLSLIAFVEVVGGKTITVPLYTWAASGQLDIKLGLYVDQLTAAMLLLVTIVSGLVHVYTIGYMHGEPGYARFFANIALFTFSMLMLVMADNFLQLFVFWEAVGLCSYLLIGHWYERSTARAAATKAFIVNRVGDFGFLLGLLVIFLSLGTLEYADVFAGASELSQGTVTAICLLLFVGAVGKSAQVPLHVWLPDAMEGPTPISALIHAATMVTAGVFMVARLAPLYNLSPVALDVVAVVGAATMVVGATIALTQFDIKRIVAYSTVSQLGYMIMACGVGAYTAGIFHLLTHGAFKALLFLCCGAVIHVLANEQDLRRMGGLRGKMPITYGTFTIGALALSGVPPFSGFFSKDEIIVSTFQAGTLGKILGILGIITAFLTAFYIFRLVFSVFHGAFRGESGSLAHAHEAPLVMSVPLLVLAVLSVVAGWVGLPGGWNVIHPFLGPALPSLEGASGTAHEGGGTALMVLSIAGGLGGIALAYVFYVSQPHLPAVLAQQWRRLYQMSFNKWYVDEAYDRTVVEPTFGLADGLWRRVDVGMIDGAVNGMARGVAWGGWLIRLVQSGQVQHYALGMTVGAVVILSTYLLF